MTKLLTPLFLAILIGGCHFSTRQVQCQVIDKGFVPSNTSTDVVFGESTPEKYWVLVKCTDSDVPEEIDLEAKNWSRLAKGDNLDNARWCVNNTCR